MRGFEPEDILADPENKDITKSIDSIDAPPSAVLKKLISNFDK